MKTLTATARSSGVMSRHRRFSVLLQLTVALIMTVSGVIQADPDTEEQLADLELSMSLDPADAVAGDSVTFALRVTNHGPQDAINVRVENQLPSGYIYRGVNGPGSYDPITGVWSVGPLAAQNVVTLQIEATVLADGAHLNIASVTSDNQDPVSDNNHAMTGIGGIDGPTIGQTNPRPPGQEITPVIAPPTVRRDTWADWKLRHPGETPAGNPDADAYDNFAEFTFAMGYDRGTGSEWLGHTAWVIRPSGIAPGTLEGVFIRPKGAYLNVTYTLQYAAALGNPTVWQSMVITPEMVTTVDNGDCTETVTIHDLETLTGMTSGEGFVRIQADLDDDGGNNGDIDHTSFTEVEGWTTTDLNENCQTYNNPYLTEALFTGTISAVSGSDVRFGTSAAPVDLATVLNPAYSYFIEVQTGDLEGHRFDIVAGAGDSLTLADGPGTTLPLAGGEETVETSSSVVVGSLPAELVGDRVAIHRHRTINDLFPATDFGASANREAADKVQVFKNGSWDNYWLFSNNGTPVWLKAGANDLVDRGTTVIPPGQGVFFENRQEATSILAYGEVRMNRFVRPLNAGHSLVGGGYPLDQSANGARGRDMNAESGFMPTNDFKTADSFFFWNGDFTTGAEGYSTYYLLNGSRSNPTKRWVKVGDATLTGRDTETLLLGDRAVFIRSKNGLNLHTMPLPWTP